MSSPDQLRESLGLIRWSQRGLADILQCDDRTVRRWFSGAAEAPETVAAWLERLAAAHADNPPPDDWRKRHRQDTDLA